MSSQNRPYGSRIVTVLIDETAQENPSKLFGIVCTTVNGKLQKQDISYLDISRAINRTAWWLEDNLGGRGSNFPTIAYLGPSDLRYAILAVAANKAGYQILFPSPRNSVEYHLHVLQDAKCNVMLRDGDTNISNIQAEKQDLKALVVPTLQDLLSTDSVKHYLYYETPDSIKEPTIVLHSSGSTGPPKVIGWTHEALCKLDSHRHLQGEKGEPPIITSIKAGTLLFNSFPMFHAYGQIFSLGHSCFYDHPNVFPPPGQVETSTILNAIRELDVKLLSIAPSVLEQLCDVEGALDQLNGRAIMYGGSPLSDAAGAAITQHAQLHCMIGTTESGEFPLLTHDREDWNYFHYPSNLPGLQFRKHDDELFEMVFTRDKETDQYFSTWITFPNLNEYSTKDLYSKHPSKSGLWRHRGRSDDTIALSTGEKFVPIPFEMKLKESRDIRDVLLIGAGRAEVSALIELNDVETPQAQALKSIHPIIEKVNKDMPRFARLSKDRIFFTSLEKPMIRAGKGSVTRKATLKLYEKEIEELYNSQGAIDPSESPLLKTDDKNDTAKSLLEIFSGLSDLDKNSDLDANIFNLGFDSLSVMRAVRTIKAIVTSEHNQLAEAISPSFIYAHPSINELASALQTLKQSPEDKTSFDETRFREMRALLQKYTAGLEKTKLTQPESTKSEIHVILTGSTGSLGSYLLDTLINSKNVAKIYALNRAQDGRSRQAGINQSRNLNTTFDKVTFLHADLGKQDLGVSKEDYEMLSQSVDVVIHNQWAVDFNLSLLSMENHIAGVRHLVDFSLGAQQHPYIMFASTVGTLGSYEDLNPDHPSAPEAILEDLRYPQPLGYTMSKQISERILNAASQLTGLRTSAVRIGQIAGPVQRSGGVWNRAEWLPSIIISSAYLRRLPSDLPGDIDWIPVDLLAETLVDIVKHDLASPLSLPQDGTMIYNMSNPRTVHWSDVKPSILGGLPSDTLEVSFEEWVQALEKSADEKQIDTVKNPSLKLLEFFENLSKVGKTTAKMQVKNGLARSSTLQNLEAVNERWMKEWMRGWDL